MKCGSRPEGQEVRGYARRPSSSGPLVPAVAVMGAGCFKGRGSAFRGGAPAEYHHQESLSSSGA